jgi:hypothetical protein
MRRLAIWVAANALSATRGKKEVGEEEEGAEHPGDGEHDGQEGPGSVAVLHDAEWEEGVRPLALPEDEGAEQRARDEKWRDDAGGAPPFGARLTEPVDEGHQAAAAEDDTRHVEADVRAPLAIRDHGECPEGH